MTKEGGQVEEKNDSQTFPEKTESAGFSLTLRMDPSLLSLIEGRIEGFRIDPRRGKYPNLKKVMITRKVENNAWGFSKIVLILKGMFPRSMLMPFINNEILKETQGKVSCTEVHRVYEQKNPDKSENQDSTSPPGTNQPDPPSR